MIANQDLFDAIVKGDARTVGDLVERDLDKGGAPEDILQLSMIPAMGLIGEQFAANEIYVPQMLIAARAMNAGLAILEPVLVDTDYRPVARVCIGTVKGDLHDIGKNIVAMMLKGAGFDVMDLGTDCDTEVFQNAVDEGAQAICLSAMLSTTLPYMKTVVDHFEGSNSARIIIGGAPATTDFAEKIGADGYASNATEAVRIVSMALGVTTANVVGDRDPASASV